MSRLCGVGPLKGTGALLVHEFSADFGFYWMLEFCLSLLRGNAVSDKNYRSRPQGATVMRLGYGSRRMLFFPPRGMMFWSKRRF